MIFKVKDSYEPLLSFDTKKYQKPFIWRHNDVLMMSKSQK